jgi:hypothetical protein
MMPRYAGLVKIAWKLSRVQTRSMFVVKGLICQNDQGGQVEQYEPGQRRGEQEGGPRPRPAPQH